MTPLLDITRRQFFTRSAGLGIGTAALSSMLEAQTSAYTGLHFPAKAKRVIYLYMAGGPSQVDLFDYKPKLAQLDGQPIPDSFISGERFAFIKGVPEKSLLPRRIGSNNTGSPARRSQISCLACKASPMTSRSSSRCTPRSSITAPRRSTFSTGFPDSQNDRVSVRG